MSSTEAKPLILLTGATGYVGGRLLRALQAAAYPVRCLARRPEFLAPRVSSGTEIVQGDCLDAASLPAACAGVDTAYYLVHSMGSTGDFAEQDRTAAANFGAAAQAAGVRRIVYLGGLGDARGHLSPHLRSRHETGEALRASGVPVIELRASVILGSGSLSFELIRGLVERLPVMLCPRWVRTPAQPIAIEDILAYLLATIDLPRGSAGIFEIGGADRVSYAGIMSEYARQRGLRRSMIPVPLLTPRLSSLWLGLTTPVYARVGRKLIESVENETTVHDDRALRVFPIRPMGFRQAIRRAILNEDQEYGATRWSDAISSAGVPPSWGGMRFGTRLVDSRAVRVPVSPALAFATVRRIGGSTGWYYGNRLWKLRGFIDLLFGGVGMRRGRRHPEQLAVGDTVDFWRVEAYEPDRRLRLVAEMKLPGRAWLEFEVQPDADGAIIRQTAVFDPVGLLGLLYWYGVYPLHARVFAGMLRGTARAAELCGGQAAGPRVAAGSPGIRAATSGLAVRSSLTPLTRRASVVRRRLVEQEPEAAKCLHRLDEVREAHRLDHVGIGTQLVAPDQVSLLARRGHDHHGDDLQTGVALDLAQHLQPVHLGHFQVEQDDRRILVGPPGKLTAPIEVVQRQGAVANGDDLVDDLELREGGERQLGVP